MTSATTASQQIRPCPYACRISGSTAEARATLTAVAAWRADQPKRSDSQPAIEWAPSPANKPFTVEDADQIELGLVHRTPAGFDPVQSLVELLGRALHKRFHTENRTQHP